MMALRAFVLVSISGLRPPICEYRFKYKRPFGPFPWLQINSPAMGDGPSDAYF